MKRCSKCKQFKELSEFHKQSRSIDGLKSACKYCRNKSNKEYTMSEKGKAAKKKYYADNKENILVYRKKYGIEHREKILKTRRKYYLTENGKLSQSIRTKKYLKTEKGKQTRKKIDAKMRILYPNRYKARKKLNYYIESGKLSRPTTCSKCNIVCKPDAHHYSYEKEHWLDVIWLCKKCHVDLHNN